MGRVSPRSGHGSTRRGPTRHGPDSPEARGLGAEFDGVLQAARQGASWALEKLYRQFHPAILAYLRTQERGDAEDLASETWIQVATGLGRFEGGEEELRRLLFTVARRRVSDLRRTRGRRRTDLTPPERLDRPEPAAGPEATVVDRLTSEDALAALVAALPPDQAEVVVLRVVAGLDASEVASIVGKRPGTVRVLQHRALRRLADSFPERRP